MRLKQKDFEKVCNANWKQISKEVGWRYCGSCIYRMEGPLIVHMSALGIASAESIFFDCSFKWHELDQLFWKIVGLEENAKMPASFHIFGAFTVPSTSILEYEVPIKSWEGGDIRNVMLEVVNEGVPKLLALRSQIQSPAENLDRIKEEFAFHLLDHPKSTKNIWVERILTEILMKDLSNAQNLCQEGLRFGVQTFGFDKMSFFNLADEYVKNLLAGKNHYQESNNLDQEICLRFND